MDKEAHHSCIKVFRVIILMGIVLFAPGAYGQPSKGIHKEEAIQLARRWAESSHPPMNLGQMHTNVIYLSKENAWIVEFVDLSPTSSPDSNYMVRVQATSGKAPQIIRGSQKERYRSYFEKATDGKNIER